jgi:membrane-anchored protein YejM (alkaline phosphatase superfamily)
MIKWFNIGQGRKNQLRGDEEDFLLITWDSCRYDTYYQARTPVLDQFGEARRAWAMATYTLPAHVAMFHGFLPHVHGPEPFYNRFRQQLWRINSRHTQYRPLVTLPAGQGDVVAGLRRHGYFTAGTGAMGWFRDTAFLQEGFRHFEYTGVAARRQNELLVRWAEKRAGHRPCFLFVNYGETHSPFRHEGMSDANFEVDRRYRRSRVINQDGVRKDHWKFDEEGFRRQIACAEYLDARTGELIDLMRRRGRPTTVVVCGDHGECFGEHGLYGHGFYHEKVMEVPLLIFRLNAPPHPAPQVCEDFPGEEHRAAA